MARTAAVERNRAVPGKAAGGTPTRAPGPVVLVVDDEPEWIRWLSLCLTDSGWVTLAASSGSDGLASFDEACPDVVITDQMMPGMSGTELAGALRRRGFLGPILLLSAGIGPDISSDCSGLGMHALSKLAHGPIFHTLDLFRQAVVAGRR